MDLEWRLFCQLFLWAFIIRAWYRVLSFTTAATLSASRVLHTEPTASERWWKETDITDDDVEDQRSRAEFSAMVRNIVTFTSPESACFLKFKLWKWIFSKFACMGLCWLSVYLHVWIQFCCTRISQTNTRSDFELFPSNLIHQTACKPGSSLSVVSISERYIPLTWMFWGGNS